MLSFAKKAIPTRRNLKQLKGVVKMKLVSALMFTMLLFIGHGFAQGGYNPDTGIEKIIWHFEGDPCAMNEPLMLRTFVGTVVKRTFQDDELTLEGFVLSHQKDRRMDVTIEPLFLQESTLLRDQLSDFLWVQRKVKVTVAVCRKLYFLHKIEPVPTPAARRRK